MKTGILKKHLWYILIGTVIAGFITEIFNQYLIRFWEYDEPWTFFFFRSFPVGMPLIIGWLVMAFTAVLLSILIIRLKPRTRFAYVWITAWIIIGFIVEIINSKIWTTWTYVEPHLWTKLIIPYLNFSIFVPILGYGGTGLITYWAYKYIIMAFGKGKEKDAVCYMKVDKQTRYKARYRKKTYYFCSEACKREFLENPSNYLQKGFF